MSRTEMSEATDSALSAAAREAMRGGAPGGPRSADRGPRGSAGGPGGWGERRGARLAIAVAIHLLAALALLAAATLLEPGLANTSWLPPLVTAVAIILTLGLTGVIAASLRGGSRPSGGRSLVSPGAWLGLGLVQVAALLVVAGLTSGIWDLAGAREAFVVAWNQIVTGRIPVEPSRELTWLLVLAIGSLAVLADRLADRAPALIALPLLVLFIVAAVLLVEPVVLSRFAVAAAAYIALLGLSASRNGSARRGAVAAVAGVGALAIGAAVLTVPLTPVGTQGRYDAFGADTIGVSPFTQLAGNLRSGDSQLLLQIEGQETPDYVRVAVLEEWVDDVGWRLGDLAEDPAPVMDVPRTVTPGDSNGEVTLLRLTATDHLTPHLPVPDSTQALATEVEGWAHDESLRMWHASDPLDPGAYRLVVTGERPSAAALAADTTSPDEENTRLDAVHPQVVALAEQVTAGAETDFARALALQQWFTDTGGFTYSLSVADGSTGNRLLDFLERKVGYCEQYASAMAVMLRSLGIPARVVVGYSAGTTNADGVTEIYSTNAHAWVEVEFDDAGWVRFDPTPADGSNLRQQGFGPRETVLGQGPDLGPGSNPGEEGQEVPDVETSAPETGAPEPTTDASSAAPDEQAGSAAQDEQQGRASLLPLVAAMLGAAILALAPNAAREMVRRRRLVRMREAGPAAADAQAWAEIEALALDHGLDLPVNGSVPQIAHEVATAALADRWTRASLDALVERLERAWYAPAPAGGAHGQDVRAAGPGAAREREGGAPAAPERFAVLHQHAHDGPAGSENAELVERLREGLVVHAPIRPADRWFPRSIRPLAWR
ncbi:transglutaminaseTgpA domain-containing protein [Serinibacter salmoneus]|uniref:Transglutaminase superfamily protein n=1 Tax=Serinibacter salmoneus TaxID=556530 RepID=A0A2A9D3P3_9MICO|nr:DUF3488 and transglutaminase-like domain-containing protein [Serinibacter salmoneus]PFG18472.1 transglutaminase superfamily protein [Serinibacter salmoneus]PFG21328.1 transglutaminase superfamily protein [Serinibacter salmoneus]